MYIYYDDEKQELVFHQGVANATGSELTIHVSDYDPTFNKDVKVLGTDYQNWAVIYFC